MKKKSTIKIGSIIQKIGCPVKNNTGWYDFNSTTTVINE